MNLFIELRKHGKLAAKRNPMYEKNKFGKFWMYFMAVFWAGYLVFFGTSFAFAFNDGATEAYHVLNSGLIFIPVSYTHLRYYVHKMLPSIWTDVSSTGIFHWTSVCCTKR